jgi:tripartite-type tricarboxylate transporter receptor subunit TctC
VAESGLPGYELTVWLGFAVSAKTPEPVVAKLEDALLKAIGSAEFKSFAAQTLYAGVLGMSGTEMSRMIEAERGRYASIVKTYDVSVR